LRPAPGLRPPGPKPDFADLSAALIRSQLQQSSFDIAPPKIRNIAHRHENSALGALARVLHRLRQEQSLLAATLQKRRVIFNAHRRHLASESAAGIPTDFRIRARVRWTLPLFRDETEDGTKYEEARERARD
jgi:hypothetical protein